MGRFWARCKLGSDLKPRSITTVTDLGLLGAAIYRAIFMDQQSKRSHPNKAVDVVACQTFQITLGFRRHQLMSAPLVLPPIAIAPTRPLGFDVFPASPWPLGSRRWRYRRGHALAQRLIHFSTHPEPVQ